ncbi:MAG TPA: hypothetical protein VGN79_14390 [Devosia sp.]|jgi:hypothetical protein|nr:hypothetical protein [Devosia sp.]
MHQTNTAATPDHKAERSKLHGISSAVDLAILALDKIADLAAAGQDVEGHIADVRMHLQSSVYYRLSEVIG